MPLPQMLIDRTRHLPGLWLALFFMAYPNRTFEYLFSNAIGMGDKEAFAWGITLAGGDYHLAPHLPHHAGGPRDGKAFESMGTAQFAPDGMLLFMHANRRDWRCDRVPKRLSVADYRYKELLGVGPLADYLRSEVWQATGGPHWGAGDFEATVWVLTRGFCAAIASA